MTNTIVNVKDLSREEWLEYRQLGIGGSDAAAACGLSKWKSPAQLYLDKTTPIETTDAESEHLRQGRDFEDYVAQRFTEATGKKVRRDNHMMSDSKYPFLIADIDRRVVGEDSILECKTTTPYNKDKWADGAIPIEYELQCLHYMSVTGTRKCYIACLIFGTDFIIREIDGDEETIQMLREKEVEFWTEYVEKGVMPEPDGSSAYDDALKNRFKGGLEESIDLDTDKHAYDLYLYNKEQIKTLEAYNKQFEQEIKLAMGDNNYGESKYFNVTYKPSKSIRLDTKRIKKEAPEIYEKYGKETESRRFLIKEIEE
jgi:putative phage-type endonuclease|nr:MAG TPA: Exonuclease [Caudoviricetes sp.]